MTAARFNGSGRATTAFPPVYGQPSMKEWQNRKRVPVWRRLLAVWWKGQGNG